MWFGRQWAELGQDQFKRFTTFVEDLLGSAESQRGLARLAARAGQAGKRNANLPDEGEAVTAKPVQVVKTAPTGSGVPKGGK